MPKIGDERYLVEQIDTTCVEALARKAGWVGDEGLREFCEPEDAATYTEHRSLDDALKAARKWLATGRSFYDCAIIDQQIFEQPYDDLGRLVRMPPQWERARSFELAADGECIAIER